MTQRDTSSTGFLVLAGGQVLRLVGQLLVFREFRGIQRLLAGQHRGGSQRRLEEVLADRRQPGDEVSSGIGSTVPVIPLKDVKTP